VLLIVVSAVPVVIWIYLLLCRGGFWQTLALLERTARLKPPAKRVVAVIPARNEANVIGEAVTSLLSQDFPAPLRIILVDDGSTDDTVGAARRAEERSDNSGCLAVVQGKPLIRGWTGKLWALSQGVEAAAALNPDYLLLTDADIRHGKSSVADLVGMAESGNYDLASVMVKLKCETVAEKALIPAFVFFFLMLYPPAWIASRSYKTAGAAGGCILIRTEALNRIGGFAAIRKEIIDDCALARSVKRSGGRVWLGFSSATESIRSYVTFREIGRMISRTAFNQLHHSVLILTATLSGLFLTYLLPPLLLISRKPVAFACGLAAWILMAGCYRPMVRFYRGSVAWSFALPAIALFYAGATIHSALSYWTGKGGKWKDRIQDSRASGVS